MRCLSALMLAIFVSSSVPAEEAAKPETGPDKSATSFWMEKKMGYTQEILRGLATSDFEAIGVNARQMRLLNRVEGFVRRRNTEYRLQLRTFERICGDMIEQADKENLAGATLAFNQLTVNCVSCHQSLRLPESGSKKVLNKSETVTENAPAPPSNDAKPTEHGND